MMQLAPGKVIQTLVTIFPREEKGGRETKWQEQNVGGVPVRRMREPMTEVVRGRLSSQSEMVVAVSLCHLQR